MTETRGSLKTSRGAQENRRCIYTCIYMYIHVHYGHNSENIHVP